MMQLEIENVSKQYRRGPWGVQNVSLKLGPGVIGLLGPNGAGKTSLMNILATITQPSNGRICWQGVDIAKEPDVLRRVLGYLPQDFGIYPHLNAVMGLYADIFSQKGFSISDFHYVGGELMAEAILDRSMMLDGATLAATTYLVLVHNP